MDENKEPDQAKKRRKKRIAATGLAAGLTLGAGYYLTRPQEAVMPTSALNASDSPDGQRSAEALWVDRVPQTPAEPFIRQPVETPENDSAVQSQQVGVLVDIKPEAFLNYDLHLSGRKSPRTLQLKPVTGSQLMVDRPLEMEDEYLSTQNLLPQPLTAVQIKALLDAARNADNYNHTVLDPLYAKKRQLSVRTHALAVDDPARPAIDIVPASETSNVLVRIDLGSVGGLHYRWVQDIFAAREKLRERIIAEIDRIGPFAKFMRDALLNSSGVINHNAETVIESIFTLADKDRKDLALALGNNDLGRARSILRFQSSDFTSGMETFDVAVRLKGDLDRLFKDQKFEMGSILGQLPRDSYDRLANYEEYMYGFQAIRKIPELLSREHYSLLASLSDESRQQLGSYLDNTPATELSYNNFIAGNQQEVIGEINDDILRLVQQHNNELLGSASRRGWLDNTGADDNYLSVKGLMMALGTVNRSANLSGSLLDKITIDNGHAYLLMQLDTETQDRFERDYRNLGTIMRAMCYQDYIPGVEYDQANVPLSVRDQAEMFNAGNSWHPTPDRVNGAYMVGNTLGCMTPLKPEIRKMLEGAAEAPVRIGKVLDINGVQGVTVHALESTMRERVVGEAAKAARGR